ncbi:hypothetical protein M409DRAFT_54062 [Zasmidium cellare ATCC 36951]|uniref:F-box domain-containing protein n=1 Tax=Zasmidium cellare ATCC 36951 TaxID=1080233 RepID=A0A6A6CJQ9_ZASCE|nr:uncharacterized protein M409DRAFT_54062 [Zasmidium cellare ATCC 36951]KAF2167464.1 hypothetical protein M409DRAFT_54062 [Zasmidium cellare ATCC 36951]
MSQKPHVPDVSVVVVLYLSTRNSPASSPCPQRKTAPGPGARPRKRLRPSETIRTNAAPTALPMPQLPCRLDASSLSHTLSIDHVKNSTRPITLTTLGKRERDNEEEQSPPGPERVFGIHELVDQILFYIPAGELLRSQSVKRMFKTVYEDSKQLQLKIFERIHGNSRPWHPLEVNPLLVKWSRWNGIRKEREHRIAVSTLEIPHIFFSEREAVLPVLWVTFKDGVEAVKIDHSESWSRLHIYDAGLPITVEVHCGQRMEEDINDQPLVLDLDASVDVRNSPLGKLLEIAKTLRQFADFTYLDDEDCVDGDTSVDVKQDASWVASVDPDLMELIEDHLRLWVRVGQIMPSL